MCIHTNHFTEHCESCQAYEDYYGQLPEDAADALQSVEFENYAVSQQSAETQPIRQQNGRRHYGKDRRDG